MKGRGVTTLLATLTLVAGAPADAQRADSSAARADRSMGALACPRDGVSARAWVGRAGVDLADSVARPSRAAGLLDTVITLNITDHRWQRDSLSAGVSLGVAGTAGARRLPWHACAGATATLGRITATLHNVHGQIHLRADPGALDAIGRTAGTPPAPPRR